MDTDVAQELEHENQDNPVEMKLDIKQTRLLKPPRMGISDLNDFDVCCSGVYLCRRLQAVLYNVFAVFGLLIS